MAEDLADDVVNIMRNKGGPVASSTFYPILKKNYDAIGYEIALEPSAETVSSVEKLFSFSPRGIPAEWSDGEFHEKTIEIRAEKFCLSCHIDAKEGSVLGVVKVRNYLSHHLNAWWAEVGLTAIMGLGKILFHTTILFFLLRVRMEPMLSLKSVVASLAKAGADLHHRAKLTSEDEFSELARDLNHFLDRLCLILEDVGHVLEKMTALNTRLSQVNSQIENKYKNIQSLSQQAMKSIFEGQTRLPLLSDEWKNAMQLNFMSLVDSITEPQKKQEVESKMAEIWLQFDETSKQLDTLNRTQSNSIDDLTKMNTELHDFDYYINEMSTLEEKMENISEQGQKLIQRLTGK